jgi:GT2 family glycosyltransferase
MSRPDVSVIVVNHNGRKHLEHLLPTLEAQTLPASAFEIILVDNGSTDDSLAWTARRHPRVRFVSLKENHGFAGANGEGIKAALGEYVALVNNDCRVDPGWMEAFMARADADAVQSGRILNWEGDRIDFMRGILTFDGHAFQLHQGFPVDREPSGGDPDLPFPCGGNCFFPRDLYGRTGGFDRDFFAYLEDVDWGWRLWQQGARVRYCPEALVHHRGSATGIRLGLFKRAFLFEKNAFMVFYKNAEDPLFHALLPAVMLAWEHRLATLMKQAPGAWVLLQDPYRDAPKKAKLEVSNEHVINHWRAFQWILHHLGELHNKRCKVQERRTRTDREFLERFPLWLIPTYPGDDLLFSNPAFLDLLPRDLPLKKAALSDILKA